MSTSTSTRPRRSRRKTPAPPPAPKLRAADVVARYAEAHPAGHARHLGPMTLARIAEEAAKAGRIATVGDDGGVHAIDLGVCVAAALVMDHGGIKVRDLMPILGRPLKSCEQMQRMGRGWVQAHEAAMAKKRRTGR